MKQCFLCGRLGHKGFTFAPAKDTQRIIVCAANKACLRRRNALLSKVRTRAKQQPWAKNMRDAAKLFQ